MKVGNWLTPRYPSREILEKDFPAFDVSALEVYCPGCKSVTRLSRKAANGRIAGWCGKCSRAVAP